MSSSSSNVSGSIPNPNAYSQLPQLLSAEKQSQATKEAEQKESHLMTTAASIVTIGTSSSVHIGEGQDPSKTTITKNNDGTSLTTTTKNNTTTNSTASNSSRQPLSARVTKPIAQQVAQQEEVNNESNQSQIPTPTSTQTSEKVKILLATYKICAPFIDSEGNKFAGSAEGHQAPGIRAEVKATNTYVKIRFSDLNFSDIHDEPGIYKIFWDGSEVTREKVGDYNFKSQLDLIKSLDFKIPS